MPDRDELLRLAEKARKFGFLLIPLLLRAAASLRALAGKEGR